MAFPPGTSNPKFAPTVITSPVTNFNQDSATFNAVVSANKYPASVFFDYSTSSTFSFFSSLPYGTVTGQNQAINYSIAGLANGTTYYVRVRAVNAIGSSAGSVLPFTTWSLKTYLNTTAGSYSVSIPSIPGVAPTIYEMLIYGGGGAAAYSGGGGGGYRLFSSHTSSVTGTQNISIVIGAGGTNPTNATPAPAGGSSTITIGSSSWVAGGGGGGRWLTDGAGAVGSGSNPAYGGGNGYYGYTYIAGYETYCCATDKLGNCTQTCPDYNKPIYQTDYNRYSGGGGAGTDGGGGNATYPDVGGNGGPGGGAYGLRGGNGGRGGGTAAFGAMGTVPAGSGPIVGTGGAGWWGSGVAGGVTFKYYGP